MQAKHVDVVIIGAGLVGLVMANALAKANLSIVLIDAKKPDFNWSMDNYDLRVSAITRASEAIFKNLDVWQSICAQRVSPYRYMQVWDRAGKGEINFDSAAVGEANLGYIIENRIMQKSLYEKLKVYNNVETLIPEKITSVIVDEKHVILNCETKKITAKLIIGADGARSWLRQQLHIPVAQKDYQHHAIVTTVKTQKAHLQTARQCFNKKSILAFLPLQDQHTCSIVWSVPPEYAKQLCEYNDADFNAAITKLGQTELGTITAQDKRVSFPLRMQHAKHYTKSRVALIGDAVKTIHPLAGQGVNLGFLDAISLAEVIIAAHKKHRDIGLLTNLRKYERWRKSHNLLMLAAMSSFKNLFASDFPGIVWGRNFGLNLANKILPFKSMSVKFAMGLVGDLPEFAKRINE